MFEIYNQYCRKVFLIGNVIYNVFCKSKEGNAFAKTRLFFGEINFLQGVYPWVHKVRFFEYLPVSLLQRIILAAGSQNSFNDHFLRAFFFYVEVFLKICFYLFVSKEGMLDSTHLFCDNFCFDIVSSIIFFRNGETPERLKR